MSAYRIFINNIRVATAALLKDGSLLQTYPQKDTFASLSSWMWWQLDHKRTNLKGFVLEYPDGSQKQFFPEKYKLFSEGRCVSAGYRTEEMFVQRFPFPSLYPSRFTLLQERVPHFGVSSYLDIKVKEPLVILRAPTQQEIRALKEASRYALRPMRVAAAAHARSFKTKQHKDYEPPNPVWDLETNTITQPSSSKDQFWDANDPNMHPAMAMVLKALSKDGKGPRRSNEGCDCGNC